MVRIRTLILLLGASTLLSQSVFAQDRPAALADKIFVNKFELYALTIDNVLDWCSINENGNTYSASMTFNDNTVVDLFAQPISGFIWGHWTGTDSDAGSGDTNQSATVTMTSDRAVLACCPFPNGTGC